MNGIVVKVMKNSQRQSVVDGIVGHLENLKDTLTQLGKKNDGDDLEKMVEVVGWFSDWILGIEPQEEEETEEESEEFEEVEKAKVVKSEELKTQSANTTPPISLQRNQSTPSGVDEVVQFLSDPSRHTLSGFKKMLVKVGIFDVDMSSTATMKATLEEWLEDIKQDGEEEEPVGDDNSQEENGSYYRPHTEQPTIKEKQQLVPTNSHKNPHEATGSKPKVRGFSNKVLETLSIIAKFCGPKKGRCMLIDVAKYIGDLKMVQNHVYNMRTRGSESLVLNFKSEGRGVSSEEIWITPLGYKVLAEYEESQKG